MNGGTDTDAHTAPQRVHYNVIPIVLSLARRGRLRGRASRSSNGLPPSEPLGHALCVRDLAWARGLVAVRSLPAPALARLVVLTTVGAFLAHPLGSIADADVEELLQRLLRPLGHLLDPDLVGRMPDVPPLTSPNLRSTGLDRPAEGVIPVRVHGSLDRDDEDEPFFGRLDLRRCPVRASLHRPAMLLRPQHG